jgi:hypothetical protein
VVPDTHRVNSRTGSLDEPDHISVPGEVQPELLGQPQAVLARAHQDLGCSQGAGSQHDEICSDGDGWAAEFLLEPESERLGAHDPSPPVCGLLDATYLDFREDLGAVGHGVRQVVHQHGVLGTEIATCHTVTTAGAGLLVHAGRIEALPEGHIDRRRGDLPIAGSLL